MNYTLAFVLIFFVALYTKYDIAQDGKFYFNSVNYKCEAVQK